MDKPAITFYIGVDWADKKHDVRAISSDNALNKHRVFRHSAEGLSQMGQWLSGLSGESSETVAVAIETKRGPVVETLLGYGFRVFHINPKQLDRFRDRFRVSGAKDDQLDAYVLPRACGRTKRCSRNSSLRMTTSFACVNWWGSMAMWHSRLGPMRTGCATFS